MEIEEISMVDRYVALLTAYAERDQIVVGCLAFALAVLAAWWLLNPFRQRMAPLLAASLRRLLELAVLAAFVTMMVIELVY